jgi:uncharacterized membrane protein YjjP (DUF1212 family)
MQELILVKIVGNPNFEEVPDNLIVKDMESGKYYIGNQTNIMDEVKTDKSNNWAKIFFYGNN